MKLYLSSYQLGDKVPELLRMLKGRTKVAVINNAKDGLPAESRQVSVSDQFTMFRELGLEPKEVDLRDYFVDNSGLHEALRAFDLVWVTGGNAFLLQKAFQQSGLDAFLSDAIEQEEFIYGGFSAGVCVLAPTLRGIELVDDEQLQAEGYNPETIWEGLGILPYHVAPHYKSDHPESSNIDKVVEYWQKQGITYKTLRDGEVIMIDMPS